MTADQRQLDLLNWLTQDLRLTVNSLTPASADASFRRYFRVVTPDNVFVVMDAPPEKENCQAFVESAQALASLGVHTPKIVDQDLRKGFLVLEDLGTRTYLDELQKNPDSLYSDAIDALIKIQSGQPSKNKWSPQNYDAQKLIEEMSLFSRWFVNKHLGRSIHEPSFAVWLHTQQILVKACLEQPQVWVHRDYHSRNLMVTDTCSPGVIDFQDIVVGRGNNNKLG